MGNRANMVVVENGDSSVRQPARGMYERSPRSIR